MSIAEIKYLLRKFWYWASHGIFGCPQRSVAGDKQLAICNLCYRMQYGSPAIRDALERIKNQRKI